MTPHRIRGGVENRILVAALGSRPTGRGTFRAALGARTPPHVLPDRLRRNAHKLLERLARTVEPNRMQPGAYKFCRWRQVITSQFVGSENGQTTGTKKPARGGLSVPVWRVNRWGSLPVICSAHSSGPPPAPCLEPPAPVRRPYARGHGLQWRSIERGLYLPTWGKCLSFHS